MRRRLAALLLALALPAAPVAAATLKVGPGEALTRPSQAARLAKDGDTVLIAPGQYYDCALWHANRLTIAATGPGVVLTDVACAGKASFVISGDAVTLRGLTFTRIRVPDGNGAGIRAEGGDLTVEDCDFTNNQVAILAAGRAQASLRIHASRFVDNGACAKDRCSDTLMVGALARLAVSDSVFAAPRAGLAIRAAAARVELRGNHFTGAAGGVAGLVRLELRGPVLLEGNMLFQEGGSQPAILLTGGAGPVALQGNSYESRGGGGTLVLNWSDADPLLQDNRLGPADTAVSTSGAWVEWLRVTAHAVYDPARALAGKVKGKLFELAGKVRRHLPF